MIIKKIINTFTLLALSLPNFVGTLQAAIHEYEIQSLDEIAPDRFQTLTGQAIDNKTLVGYDVDDTLTTAPKGLKRSQLKNFIFNWKNNKYTLEHYGCQFSTRQEALEYYKTEILRPILRRLDVASQGILFNSNTSSIMQAINNTGATSVCVTKREGTFENFDEESRAHNLMLNMHEKVLPDFKDKSSHYLHLNKNQENHLDGKEHAKKMHKKGLYPTYQNGVIYTGNRKLKGLCLKTFLQANKLIPHYHEKNSKAPVFETFIFVDNKKSNFSEMKKVLKPYFKNIYFFHLKSSS